jgi:hypothetical protein
MTVAVTVLMPFPVQFGWGGLVPRQISDVLNAVVHAPLQFGVEFGTFLLYLAQISQFRFETDTELVAGILRESNFLGVVGFEGDHVVSFG